MTDRRTLFRRLLTRRRSVDPDPDPSPPEAPETAPVTDPGPPEDGDAPGVPGTAGPPGTGEASEASPPPPRPTPIAPSPNALRGAPEGWLPLGSRAPGTLHEARLQLHHLLQIPAAFGGTFVTPEPDDSHRALAWSPEIGGFRSRGAELAGSVYMVVRPLPLEVQIRAVGDVHRYVLPGHTLDEAWSWAERELGLILGRGDVSLDRPEYDIQDHRVAHHALFDASPMDLEELGRWFGDAWLLLNQLRRECPEFASPVQSWPHHFDTATLLRFGEGPEGEPRTVGVGLSPGDEQYDEPYLYVAPWPRPDGAPDHELPSGCWQEAGWVGAVLPARELIEGTGPEQEERARAFVHSALGKARELLP